MKISITCAANGNNKQPLLFRTIRREHARGRDQSLEWLFRLKGLCKAEVREVYFPPKPSMQKGKQGFDCFQANQAVLMTLLLFFSASTWAPLCTSVCAGSWETTHPLHDQRAGPAANMEGKKMKTGREAWNLQSDMLSKLLVGMVVMPPALGKKLSLTVSLKFIGKIIKTFSF